MYLLKNNNFLQSPANRLIFVASSLKRPTTSDRSASRAWPSSSFYQQLLYKKPRGQPKITIITCVRFISTRYSLSRFTCPPPAGNHTTICHRKSPSETTLAMSALPDFRIPQRSETDDGVDRHQQYTKEPQRNVGIPFADGSQ